jgi:hypothetical protein
VLKSLKVRDADGPGLDGGREIMRQSGGNAEVTT